MRIPALLLMPVLLVGCGQADDQAEAPAVELTQVESACADNDGPAMRFVLEEPQTVALPATVSSTDGGRLGAVTLPAGETTAVIPFDDAFAEAPERVVVAITDESGETLAERSVEVTFPGCG